MKPYSNVSLPKIVENLLGRGLSNLGCKYDQTFICNAMIGAYANEGDVF